MVNINDVFRRVIALTEAECELLWCKVKQGNEDAFQTLVSNVLGQVIWKGCCYRAGLNGAHDLFQDVVIWLREHRQEFASYADVKRAGLNRVYSVNSNVYQKAARRKQHEFLAGVQGKVQTSSDVQTHEIAIDVRDALNKLDHLDRLLLSLRHFEGLTFEEIGQILHMDRETAAKRVRLAEDRLRKKLEDYAPVQVGIALETAGATPPPMPPVQVSEWVSESLLASHGPVAKFLATAALIACAGGFILAAYPLTPQDVTHQKSVLTSRSTVPQLGVETYNRIVFEQEVKPILLAELSKFALGQNGSAELQEWNVLGTRVGITVTIRHGAPFQFKSVLIGAFDTHTRLWKFHLDRLGNDNYIEMHPDRPIKIRDPLGLLHDWEIKSEAYSNAIKAFERLPSPDSRSATEWVQTEVTLRQALRPYIGNWTRKRKGQPDESVRITLESDLPGAHFDVGMPYGGLSSNTGTMWLRPDGSLGGALSHDHILLDHGKRIQFSNGEVWLKVSN